MTPLVTLLETSARVAPGLLTADAWDLVRRVPVCCADPAHPQLAALRSAGVDVTVLAELAEVPWSDEPGGCPLGPVRSVATAAGASEVVWLPEPAGAWPGPTAAVDAHLRAHATGEPRDGVRLLAGTHDLPGARLLDVVAVMDRLRSPGGCPWDAEQTHLSLAPYLLEEAYEAYQALEDANPADLREELGDVLMQVVFHARVAEDATDGPVDAGGGRFDVDEVAAGLASKLVRRHPHVFGDVDVAGADEVVTNWEAIKKAEKGRRSVTEGVPLTQPALSLAAKLQKRARKAGLPADLVVTAAPNPAGATRGPGAPPADADLAAVVASYAGADKLDEHGVGELLFAVVALAAAAGVDPEVALRARARAFRDLLSAAEESAHTDGVEPAEQDAAGWRTRWSPAGS
ncbi:nucleoside triphosphate pyrophosphohydrolase [Pseudofrankia inefficax]|uniref:MazG family protein n=1 Tax=Pseudofrankia inefficax (strain DSM 45817 / CECT 9037 / DDB 130130 / EuI1c) TaxID=298654 RepID=E3JCN2_PSEI1|nr:MazG family protein [Pseudofrankia inefficax]ADP78728.1 MazG family protein [Pseudofrankia inefficax]